MSIIIVLSDVMSGQAPSGLIIPGHNGAGEFPCSRSRNGRGCTKFRPDCENCRMGLIDSPTCRTEGPVILGSLAQQR